VGFSADPVILLLDFLTMIIKPPSQPPVTYKRPNPPTPEAVAKAQFVDKTYVWKAASPKAKSS